MIYHKVVFPAYHLDLLQVLWDIAPCACIMLNECVIYLEHSFRTRQVSGHSRYPHYDT